MEAGRMQASGYGNSVGENAGVIAGSIRAVRLQYWTDRNGNLPRAALKAQARTEGIYGNGENSLRAGRGLN